MIPELGTRNGNSMCRTVTLLYLCLITLRLNTQNRSWGIVNPQFSHDQIPVDDNELISEQHDIKLDNHPHSQASKQPGTSSAPGCRSKIDDLVYLYCYRNKLKTRDRYIVVSCDSDWRYISKFSGSNLRRTVYRAKDSDCYLIPAQKIRQDSVPINLPSDDECDESMDLENNVTKALTHPSPPPISTILSHLPTPLHPSSPADKLTEPLVSEITHPDSTTYSQRWWPAT